MLDKRSFHTYRAAGLRAFTAAAAAVMLTSACSSTVSGNSTSTASDPLNMSGIPTVGGPTGLRPNAPAASRSVTNTDGGQFDRVAAQSISDIEDFWKANYSKGLPGVFTPVRELVSWDAEAPPIRFCGIETAELVNAAFCTDDITIGWDRGVLLPALAQARGDIAITLVMAHEYGHAIQQMSNINPRKTLSLVEEQQADCFAGVYLRWVADGESTRFTLNTSDGLNAVLATTIVLRDSTPFQGDLPKSSDHGSAFDRVSALQMGFTTGASECAAIGLSGIKQRRAGLPQYLPADQSGELPVSEVSVTTFIEAMKVLFPLKSPPQLALTSAQDFTCSDARPSTPTAYCPADNTIFVNIPGLRTMGTPREKLSGIGLQGDNTAYSALVSRYMLAWQRDRGGLTLTDDAAGIRTACLTGVATAELVDNTTTPDGNTISLSAGDVDEAVSGLITNGVAASDVNGEAASSGFSRVTAFREGLTGNADRCVQLFP